MPESGCRRASLLRREASHEGLAEGLNEASHGFWPGVEVANEASRIDARRYDKFITTHQLHSHLIEEIHHDSLLSYLYVRMSIRS